MNDLKSPILSNLFWLMIFSLGMVFHSIEQISCNDVETGFHIFPNFSGKTWLPWWLLTDQNWFGLPESWPWKIFDGFHIVKGLSLTLIGYSVGMGFYHTLLITQKLWQIVGIELIKWLIVWQVFNVFYHIIWRIPV